jgi:hypothetical protein
LEVVSVNLDEHLHLGNFAKFLKEQGSTWTHTSVSVQPTGPALQKFVDLHCRIHSFPTAVLIGPDGKIVAMDDELEGPVLQQTLERLIPASSNKS